MSNVIESVKGFISKTSWTIEKHAPEILLVCGIATTIAGVVTACRATIKAKAVIDEHKEQMDAIDSCEDAGLTTNEDGNQVEYTAEDAKKDRLTTRVKTVTSVVKLYLLSFILISLSIFCQIRGYRVLAERLAMASAAYAALAARFKRYRGIVARKFGPQEDKAIYHDMQSKDVTMTRVDENGNEFKEKVTVMLADDDDYTAIFSQRNSDGTLNPFWHHDCDRNLNWLKMEQSYLNKLLKCRNGKPVTLNEVRDRLGLPLTAKGQAVGWVYDPKNPKHNGDNLIDFGLEPMYQAYRQGEEIPGEASLVLEFNVDGDILYAFDKYKDKEAA